MNRQDAFRMFEETIKVASAALLDLYKSGQSIRPIKKADDSLVSIIDEAVDVPVNVHLRKFGLPVVSEESENDIEAVRRGNYVTSDPVDGSGHAVRHFENAKSRGLPTPFDLSLGRAYDYCLLLGVVLDGKPRFGCYYNYVTGEKILVDSESANHIIWEGRNQALYNARYARYTENRTNDKINALISKDTSVSTFNVGPLGIRCLYVQLNGHESAVAVHLGLQENGLWDILPACVATQFTRATILDGLGSPIKFTEYVLTPNKGVVAYLGNKFSWVGQRLKETSK